MPLKARRHPVMRHPRKLKRRAHLHRRPRLLLEHLEQVQVSIQSKLNPHHRPIMMDAPLSTAKSKNRLCLYKTTAKSIPPPMHQKTSTKNERMSTMITMLMIVRVVQIPFIRVFWSSPVLLTLMIQRLWIGRSWAT